MSEPRLGIRPLVGSVILATIVGAGAGWLLCASMDESPPTDKPTVVGVPFGGHGGAGTSVAPASPPSPDTLRRPTTVTPRPTSTPKPTRMAPRSLPAPKPSKTKVNKGYCDWDSPGDCADTDILKSYDAYKGDDTN